MTKAAPPKPRRDRREPDAKPRAQPRAEAAVDADTSASEDAAHALSFDEVVSGAFDEALATEPASEAAGCP